MVAFTKEEKVVLRRVREATKAKDAADVEWRQAIVAAHEFGGISNRQIERFAGTTNTNVGNIVRRAAEMKILAREERKKKREAKATA